MKASFEFAKTRTLLQNKVTALSKAIDPLHFYFLKSKEFVPVLFKSFQEIKSDIFALHLKMLSPVSVAPPPMLQLSAAMDRMNMSSGLPSSDPFDSLGTISVIDEAERINSLLVHI